MKKTILACLAVVFLISACGKAGPSTPTPTPEGLPPPIPTPSINYQIVGSTKAAYMVVVDPASSTDRNGLQRLSDYLCADRWVCFIWYWDDIQKADKNYPVDPANEETCIAYYKLDSFNNESKLLVYALGDK